MSYQEDKLLQWSLTRKPDGSVNIYLFGETDFVIDCQNPVLKRENPTGGKFTHIKNDWRYGEDFT